MKVGLLSDIHEFNWIKRIPSNVKENYMEYFIKNIIFKNYNHSQYDIFIIAGDISELPSRIIYFLDMFQKITGIKNIIFVPGNHEHYSISKVKELTGNPFIYGTKEEVDLDITTMTVDKDLSEYFLQFDNEPIEKVNQLVRYINNNIPNVIALNDGKTFEINGIKIAGTSAWYDCKFFHRKMERIYGPMNFNSKIFQDKLKNIYKKDLDSEMVNLDPYHYWITYYKEIVENIENNLDIIITHINPMIERIGLNNEFLHSDTNAFFTFDGLNYIYEKQPKYWIHGHSHDFKEWEIGKTKIIRSSLGNPDEYLKRGGKVIIKELVF